jgi:hypothetical protein
VLHTFTPSASASLRGWLDAVADGILHRQIDPRDAARDLLETHVWQCPHEDPAHLVGQIAEIGRVHLPLACAVIHHAEGSLLWAQASGSRRQRTGLLWSLPQLGMEAIPGEPWRVSGRTRVCCAPPDSGVTYVVPARREGVVMGVHPSGPDDDVATLLGTEDDRVLVLDKIPAHLVGSVTVPQLHESVLLSRLLECAAWYGAMTRLADGMLAVLADEEYQDERGTIEAHVAETDTMLHASWAAIRDAVAAWQRAGTSPHAAAHHVARARTLARLAATSVVFAYMPMEDAAARRLGNCPTNRLHLVEWLKRGNPAADASIVATSVLSDGPSW